MNNSQTYGEHRRELRTQQRQKNLADLIAGGMMIAILVLAIVS